ncbi:hypothetical protein DFA_11388 [Cavenderia fasciculata]|uniref:Cyclin-like domain-containing protein n=1 Tax=Cavenderia fasciculata TaxID=261658 RepID=F4QCP5_CACFS|nr:uncharacterized protein DFA_11388 [Cavenderia fasciculata]EGG13627.1 hypothetical protein DFA_11388 [Cavenderia fasciculata]|eukprot:XP_004350331.1 hypothetical protein DFA_11388 [Cavenderia fasciculata]
MNSSVSLYPPNTLYQPHQQKQFQSSHYYPSLANYNQFQQQQQQQQQHQQYPQSKNNNQPLRSTEYPPQQIQQFNNISNYNNNNHNNNNNNNIYQQHQQQNGENQKIIDIKDEPHFNDLLVHNLVAFQKLQPQPIPEYSKRFVKDNCKYAPFEIGTHSEPIHLPSMNGASMDFAKVIYNCDGTVKTVNNPKDKTYNHPESSSLECWNFSGSSTSRIYQALNKRSEFHKNTAHTRVIFVKKVFSWLATHDREYLANHKTVDLVTAISDILNMIISLIELHRAPPFLLYLIIHAADRFVERTGINHHQIFNLLLTSGIVNLKFWNEGLYIQNKTIADIFSFNVKDLNTMERRFLFGLDYNLCVTEDQLSNYIVHIKNQSLSNIHPIMLQRPQQQQKKNT